ncbi:hypothetical protein SNQ38_000958, partial [Cronobacter sakazakii]|nr:hypothetical protein [Cronobacter sakazakii]
MNKIFDYQQINFFTDNNDVTASPHIIKGLLEVLGKYNLIPSFGQEINAMTGEQKQIVAMIEPQQHYRIEFPSGMLSILGINMDASSYTEQSINILRDLKSIFPSKKSNRLAYIHNLVFQSSPETYQQLYKKLFTYHAVEPFEWDSRIAVKKNLDEPDNIVNSISTIRRGLFQMPLISGGIFAPYAGPIDCISFEMDTNTAPENNNFRFDLENCSVVFDKLFAENNALIK